MRNHFVPVFLQKPWVNINDGKVQVHRISDRGIETIRRFPAGNGYEEDLFALTENNVAGMDKHAIEQVFLQEVDSRASQIHRLLISDEMKGMSHKERCSWVRFIMSLWIRNPVVVGRLKGLAEKLMKDVLNSDPELYQSVRPEGFPATMEEYVSWKYPGAIENAGLGYFARAVDNESMGTKILQLNWMMCNLNEAKHNLLLADDPCIRMGRIDDADFGLILPVSPKWIFLAYRDEKFASALNQMSPDEIMKRINELSVLQAQESVFAYDPRSLQFFRNRRRMPVTPQ